MRILHLGLPNSIHLARWIETLAGCGWDQHVLAVNAMAPCDEMRGLTVHYLGDSAPALTEAGGDAPRLALHPSETMVEVIRSLAPDVLHAHGIQLAGYPLLDAHTADPGTLPPVVVSCWGSDIFHFGAERDHARKIRAVLEMADCYVADSRRDLRLARGFGLRGEGVVVGSVAGGFDLPRLATLRQPGPISARRTIMIKGRNVWVYRGLVAMEALERNVDLLQGYRVVVYADHERQMRQAVERLAQTPGVEAELLSHVPYDEILRAHGQARLSISLSVSDGTNLSFLEAIAMGSFPIQSDRSATIEWARHGESALFVGAEDVDAVAAAIRRALTDDALVDHAAELNAHTVQARLAMPEMRAQLTTLYEHVALRGSRGGQASTPVDRPDTVGDRSHDPARPRDLRVDSRLPLVTMITPTYNRADLLPETIDSIISQDYPNLEYIVLDDGSTDDTQAVLQRYKDEVRWTYHPNMGQPRTVNRGLEMAQGDIIGIVSSDDPLLPGALSALVKVFQDNPDVLVVYPDWNLNDEHGNLLYHVRTLDYSYVDMLRLHHTYPGPCALFRRSVVERIGGYDPSYRFVPDYDFWLRAGLLGPFLRVPHTLATYRSHATTITNAERGELMAKEHVRVIDSLYARDDLPPEVLAVKAEAYRNAYYTAGVVLNVNTPSDERYAVTDQMFTRIYGQPMQGQAEVPEPAVHVVPPVDVAPKGRHPRWRPRLFTQRPRERITAAYDWLSASGIGRIKHAVPLDWRVNTRRWLSKAGR